MPIINPPSPLPQRFGRWRLFGPFTGGIGASLTTTTSNGTTQTSKTDRVAFTTPNFAVADPMFLYANTYWTNLGVPSLIGNAITIKASIEIFGTAVPITLPNPTAATLTTPAQSGVTYVVSAGATSATQTFVSTSGMQVGCTVHFNNANVNAVIKTVVSATQVTFFTSVTSTTSDNACTVTAYPWSGYVIPDGQYIWSQHSFGLQLAANTSYPLRTFVQVGANQAFANILPYSYTGGQKSSDLVTGGTTDGADYTTNAQVGPGVGNSSSYYFTPIACVGRQLTPALVFFNTGDSIAYGAGNNNYQGIMGTAIAAAGYYCWTAGLFGITATNYGRGAGVVHSLAQYADIITVSLGSNDIATGSSLATLNTGLLLAFQELTAAGQPAYIMTQTPRTTSGNSWQTLGGQTPATAVAMFQPLRCQWNNSLRDTSPNGLLAYLNTNLGTTGSVAGYMDIAKGIEVNSDGSALVLTNTTYTFTCTSANATYLATYTDSNGNVHTVGPTIAAGTTLVCTSPSSSNVPASGTLTKTSGTGDATITFSSRLQSSANQQAFGTGQYWPVNGTANYPTSDGIHPAVGMNALAAPYITGASSPISFAIPSGNYTVTPHP